MTAHSTSPAHTSTSTSPRSPSAVELDRGGPAPAIATSARPLPPGGRAARPPGPPGPRPIRPRADSGPPGTGHLDHAPPRRRGIDGAAAPPPARGRLSPGCARSEPRRCRRPGAPGRAAVVWAPGGRRPHGAKAPGRHSRPVARDRACRHRAATLPAERPPVAEGYAGGPPGRHQLASGSTYAGSTHVVCKLSDHSLGELTGYDSPTVLLRPWIRPAPARAVRMFGASAVGLPNWTMVGQRPVISEAAAPKTTSAPEL